MDNSPFTTSMPHRVAKARADLAALREELAITAGVSGDQSHRAQRLAEALHLLSQLTGGVEQLDAAWGSTFSAMLWLLQDEAHMIALREMIEGHERHIAIIAA